MNRAGPQAVVVACFLVTLLVSACNAHVRAFPDPSIQSDFEKAVLRELNLARTAPKSYAEFIEDLLPYFDGKLLRRPGRVTLQTEEGRSAAEEAVKFLRAAQPVPRLRPSPGMSQAALDHVADLGPGANMGHQGSDGSQVWDRVNRYGQWKGLVGENIQYGGKTPRDVVMDLIIDDSIPDRSHRKSIFEGRFRVAGIGCGNHGSYEIVCVITFSADYIEGSPASKTP